MKSSSKTTAALALSLLVFPGSGHFVVGRPFRGIFWGGVFGLILTVLVVGFAVNVGKMADGLMSPTGDVPWDVHKFMTMAILGLASFVVWGLAGLDAYLLARSLPKVAEGESLPVTPATPQSPAPPPPPEF